MKTNLHHLEFDPTAMSMSLADGLVKRLEREVTDTDAKLLAVLRNIQHTHYQKFNRAYKDLKEAIVISGVLNMTTPLEKGQKYHRHYLTVAWHEGAFRFQIITYQKTGLSVRLASLCITRHALARVIFRLRPNNCISAFAELLEASYQIDLGRAMLPEGEEFNLPTSCGMAVCVRDKDKITCVTWVDRCKVHEGQIDEDNRNAIHDQTARIQSVPIWKSLDFTEQVARDAFAHYVTTGGTMTFEEFEYNTEAMIDSCHAIGQRPKHIVSLHKPKVA